MGMHFDWWPYVHQKNAHSIPFSHPTGYHNPFQSSSSAVSHFDATQMNPDALVLYLQGEQEKQKTEQARLKFENETEQARLKFENETEQARLALEQERQRTEQNRMNFETAQAQLKITDKQIELTKLTSTPNGKRALTATVGPNGEPIPIPATAAKRARAVPKGACQTGNDW